VDLSLPISYNGLTTQPLTISPGGGGQSGILMTRVDMAQIPVDVRIDKLPLNDGSTLSDAYLTGRPITFTADVYGTSKGQMWDLIESWLAAFSPRGVNNPVLAFSQPTADVSTWTTGLIPLYMTAYPVKEPWYRIVDRKDSKTGGHVMQVGAELFAADPYKYATVRGITAPNSSTSAYTVVPYRGNAYSMAWTIDIVPDGGWHSLEFVFYRLYDEAGFVLGGPPLETPLEVGHLYVDLSTVTTDYVRIDGRTRTVQGAMAVVEAPLVYETLSGVLESNSIFSTLGPRMGVDFSYLVEGGASAAAVLDYNEAWY
jgi:hypothetical protein